MVINNDSHDMDLEKAIDAYYSEDSNQTSENFLEACQILIDTGFWLLMDKNVAQTCTILIEKGVLLPPEKDQRIGDSEFFVKGFPRIFH
jgi:hypothetical protein